MFDAVAPGGGQQGRALAAAATVGKRLFGHEVIFVEFKGAPLFKGAMSDAIPGVVFIRADSSQLHLAVLGQELLHRLRARQAGVYAALTNRLDRPLVGESCYIEQNMVPAFSRSAMNEVGANIRRGREAMSRALIEQSDHHRALLRNGLGWVDFVWGDEERSIAHVIARRIAKDGMAKAQVDRMLTDRMIETIALGSEVRRRELGGSERAVVALGEHEAILGRNRGSSTWLLSVWEVSPGANVPANDSSQATQTDADSSDAGLGAGDGESLAFQRTRAETASATPVDSGAWTRDKARASAVLSPDRVDSMIYTLQD